MNLDLHVHTSASDGSVKAPRVARMAAAAGLDVLAIADHDTTAGVAAAIAAAPDSLRIIPAIEISCGADGGDIHLLGYFVDPDHPALAAHTARVVGLREARMRSMIERLGGLGIQVEYEAVREEAGADAVLGRPHLARVLVLMGVVPSVGRAFELYLSDRGPAWAPVDAVTVGDAIDIVHGAGGLAVWAHPAADDLDRRIDAFVEVGLDGVECIRSRATPAEVERAMAATRKRLLIPTGGSDWHGAWHGRLGDFMVRGEQLPEFVEVLEAKTPSL